MSKDFYFYKWKETLKHLKELVNIDIRYQVTKAHDSTLSEAVHRLSSILGQYMLMYNQVIECFHQNLQVQKSAYMNNIIKALVSRILELKHELQKLEGSRFQFIGRGLIEVHHTICDIEMTAIPVEPGRSEHIQREFDKIMAKVKKKKETIVRIVEKTEEAAYNTDNLWFAKENTQDIHKTKVRVDEIPEATRKTKEYLAMILAHEKTRQVIRSLKQSKLKREIWEKELNGRLQPPARYEIREKCSKLIQTVFRAYFEIKRERIKTCRRHELLGLNICDIPIDMERNNAEEMLRNRSKLHQKYEKEWLVRRKELKEWFVKNKRAKICEESREQIREWFIEWFESVQFFYDIPKDGSAAIFRGEVPSPQDWLKENKALTIQNQVNKKKNPQDLYSKREEQIKIKAEALLLKKMMKNQTKQSRYTFPLSKRSDQLLQIINNYYKSWDIYDVWETSDVKEKYVHKVDVEDTLMEVQLEVLPEVDKHMRQELRQLKQALKKDYQRNEEKMPVDVTKPIKSEKKKMEVKIDLNKQVLELIEDLALHGFIIEYPRRNIGDFIGDPNFGGEDLRRQILPAWPFNFEIRAYWWEKCREVSNGFRKILLVGPKSSGKSILVQALASINDAVLFELNPYKIQEGLKSAPLLKRLVNMVATCAKALQPAVIHIKYIHKLFSAKIPPQEAEMNLPLMKTLFVQKLSKKMHKTDKITIIGTCTDPWLTKSRSMLKQFPVVLLLPDNTYSLVVQMLKEWVVKHKVIPADFNVSNLAQVLQGYSFGYLKDALEKFMSADRIVKIAAFGLSPMEVYNYIIEDENETKVEYDKYLKWYTENTTSGKKEMQHLQEERLKAAVEEFVAKKKKKARLAPNSTTASHTGL